MSDETSALLEVGRIDKAHGVTGDVVVTLSSDRVERLDPGSKLSTDDGQLTVVESRPHQHRWLVRFDSISTRDAAERARGTVLFAEPIEDPDVLWVHELIGSDVVTVDGDALGSVAEVEENPASDLLVLHDGSLVPLTFFVEWRDGAIVVDPPDGLFDPVDAGPGS